MAPARATLIAVSSPGAAMLRSARAAAFFPSLSPEKYDRIRFHQLGLRQLPQHLTKPNRAKAWTLPRILVPLIVRNYDPTRKARRRGYLLCASDFFGCLSRNALSVGALTPQVMEDLLTEILTNLSPITDLTKLVHSHPESLNVDSLLKGKP
jgi:hypothetical protein